MYCTPYFTVKRRQSGKLIYCVYYFQDSLKYYNKGLSERPLTLFLYHGRKMEIRKPYTLELTTTKEDHYVKRVLSTRIDCKDFLFNLQTMFI